jgi:rhodanese-related sulfurtransferase
VSYSPSAGGLEDAAVTAAADVRAALLSGAEIALVDVRPEGSFADGHPLFAASLPLGRLEAEVLDRLPRRSVRVVVYGADDDTGDARVAVRRLREIGYTGVTVLDGGLAGWAAAGGELFRDVNAPSKAFGELVAEEAKTPFIAAAELAGMITAGNAGGDGGGRRCVVLDARSFGEFTVMSIPTATSMPGAELVLRASALAADTATTIVVNCAGRTRSIIGTQSLINVGMPNRVMALRNGTIGWTLAGLELDHGRRRRAPTVTAEAAERARAAGWAVAAKAGVRRITAAELTALEGSGERTVYRFDVRTPEEYAAGHLPGFRSAPGGQLVQETDWYAPVRGALVVLAEDSGGRAAMTASWLAQMNWDVAVTEPGSPPGAAETGGWVPARPPVPTVPVASPAEVSEWLRAGEATVIDVDSSPRFLAGHLPGAAWALRTDLPRIAREAAAPARHEAGTRRIVLTSSDGYLAAWAASDLGDGAVVLAGGTDRWARSGRPLEPGHGELLSELTDVYRRPYEGTDVDPSVMQAYLDWEYGLVAQLERDGTHGFRVILP